MRRSLWIVASYFTAEQMTTKRDDHDSNNDFEIKILDFSEVKFVLETPG